MSAQTAAATSRARPARTSTAAAAAADDDEDNDLLDAQAVQDQNAAAEEKRRAEAALTAATLKHAQATRQRIAELEAETRALAAAPTAGVGIAGGASANPIVPQPATHAAPLQLLFGNQRQQAQPPPVQLQQQMQQPVQPPMQHQQPSIQPGGRGPATAASHAAAKRALAKQKKVVVKKHKTAGDQEKEALARGLRDRGITSVDAATAAEKMSGLIDIIAQADATEENIAAALEEARDGSTLAEQETLWDSIAAEIDNLNSDGTLGAITCAVLRVVDSIVQIQRCYKCGAFDHEAGSRSCEKFEPRGTNPRRSPPPRRQRERERSRSRDRDRDRSRR